MILQEFLKITEQLDARDMAIGAIIMAGFLLIMIMSAASPDDWN